jgi:hypothetical protein
VSEREREREKKERKKKERERERNRQGEDKERERKKERKERERLCALPAFHWYRETTAAKKIKKHLVTLSDWKYRRWLIRFARNSLGLLYFHSAPSQTFL